MIINEPRRLGGWKTTGDHWKYTIVENNQNTGKGPGYLRRLAVTQTLKSKRHSMEWNQNDFPIKKRFQTQCSAKTVMLAIFSDMEELISTDFLEKCSNVKSTFNWHNSYYLSTDVVYIYIYIYIMVRILRKVLETWGDLLSIKLQWKTICVLHFNFKSNLTQRRCGKRMIEIWVDPLYLIQQANELLTETGRFLRKVSFLTLRY